MKVVLYHPEIPQNTGNIGRLCVATKTPLYLVRPLGFSIDSKEIRRSGLDYWKDLQVQVVDHLEEVREQNPESKFWYLSTKGKKRYFNASFQESDILVFGSEGSGLPPDLIQQEGESVLTIPQWGPVRSLNLSTSVGIVVYEAYRQVRF
ncbi:MAG: tRNA (cytidine(34)-2'-O)-methyltransferase, partial [Deltaproteobacteria bacterium]|nr:tRNA (cytidine(34)-2'-O)-methyltransferase [Deltaproteobacteria bacterium]